jgi:tRNA(Ile)-lysidine synthase
MFPLPDLFLERVAETIARHGMISAGERIGVAVSSGADSVVLLHVLHKLAAPLQIELIVLHLNYRLRGPESDADEHFVRGICDQLSLKCVATVRPIGDEENNLEQAARNERRRFFFEQMQSGVVNRVATGHTLSDQAETVLFRLFRGAGLAGLSGMRFQTSDKLIRPLLALTRSEVREWAAAQGLSWREDSSNLNPRFRRNRIRHEFLPLAREAFHPQIEKVLAGTAMLAQTEEQYWDELLTSLFPKFVKMSHFGLIGDIHFLQNQHLAVQRRLIRRALCETKGDLRGLDSTHIEAVIGICGELEGHDRVMVPGVDVLRSFHQLRFMRSALGTVQYRHYRVPLDLGVEIELPFEAGALRLDVVQGDFRDDDICANFKDEQGFAERARLGWGVLSDPGRLAHLAVRNWEPGDAYQRLGHRGTEKLKVLFQEQKVPLWERRHWPVLEFNDDIVWTRQFGASARFGAADDSSRALLLRYRPARESNMPVVTSRK